VKRLDRQGISGEHQAWVLTIKEGAVEQGKWWGPGLSRFLRGGRRSTTQGLLLESEASEERGESRKGGPEAVNKSAPRRHSTKRRSHILSPDRKTDGLQNQADFFHCKEEGQRKIKAKSTSSVAQREKKKLRRKESDSDKLVRENGKDRIGLEADFHRTMQPKAERKLIRYARREESKEVGQ